jgi:hypothetical protein
MWRPPMYDIIDCIVIDSRSEGSWVETCLMPGGQAQFFARVAVRFVTVAMG